MSETIKEGDRVKMHGFSCLDEPGALRDKKIKPVIFFDGTLNGRVGAGGIGGIKCVYVDGLEGLVFLFHQQQLTKTKE